MIGNKLGLSWMHINGFCRDAAGHLYKIGAIIEHSDKLDFDLYNSQGDYAFGTPSSDCVLPLAPLSKTETQRVETLISPSKYSAEEMTDEDAVFICDKYQSFAYDEPCRDDCPFVKGHLPCLKFLTKRERLPYKGFLQAKEIIFSRPGKELCDIPYGDIADENYMGTVKTRQEDKI